MIKTKPFIVFIFLIAILVSFGTSVQKDFAKSVMSMGVVVEDFVKSLQFYQNVKGMVKVSEFIFDSEKAKGMGLSKVESFDIKVLKLENSEEATELKLMFFNEKTSCKNQNFIPDENGIHRLAGSFSRIQDSHYKTNPGE